jgi:hypothetical protein
VFITLIWPITETYWLNESDGPLKPQNVSSTFLNLPSALMQLIELEMCSMLRVETADT